MAAVRVATLARVAARAADGGAAERAGCPQVDDDPAVRVQSDSELATRLSVDTRKHTGFQYMLRVFVGVARCCPFFTSLHNETLFWYCA